MRTWLTADPFRQDENHLYSYCFQNPLLYADPDGQFTIVIPLIDLTLGVLGKAIMKGLCLGGAAWLGAKGVEKTNEYLKEQEKKKCIEESKRAEATRQLQEADQITETNLSRSKEKTGRQKDGCPGDHIRQNKQAKGAIKEIERQIGRELTRDEKRQVHDTITGKNFNYHEIIEEGIELFKSYK